MINLLKEKTKYVFKETLKIHKISPDTRVASSLSCIEIFVALFYGKILKFNPKNPLDENRDRFIVSKGHGSISLYPILADLGFFNKEELNNVGKKGSFLGSIPDPIIPGYETINGSLGHGLGVGCGMALGLKKRNKQENVVVLMVDGELYEGAVWEAVMFAPHHKLDNLTLIIDHNKISMLDYLKNIIDITPIIDKFKIFKWKVYEVLDGHNIIDVYNTLKKAINEREKMPKAVIVHTKKGKGVKKLEENSLCHVFSISKEEIDAILDELK